MMIPLLFTLLTLACGSPAEQTAATTVDPVAQTASRPTESAPKAEASPTLTACEMFTPSDFNNMIGCVNLTINTGDGSNCSFSCSAPFAMLIVTLGYNEKGYVSVIERKRGNPALESLTIEGADEVAFQPQQCRFDIYKGRHSINFVAPDNGGDQKALGLKMAKLMVSRLP